MPESHPLSRKKTCIDIKDLKFKYRGHEIVQEVRSGFNFQRKGFQKLVNQLYKGMLSERVIIGKHRPYRFVYLISCNIFSKGFTPIYSFIVKRKTMNGNHQRRNSSKTFLPS